jgi:FtsH-binding integral membrane protein
MATNKIEKKDYENDLNELLLQEQRQTDNKPLSLKDIHTSLRLAFIRKVYGILSCQLLMTTLFCLISMYSESFYAFQISFWPLLIISLIGTLVIAIIVSCYPDQLRKVPRNYIILFTFTLFESYIISFICGTYNPQLVFMAAFMTFAMVLGLTVYAMTTKTDITTKGGLLCILSVVLLVLTIFSIFTDNPFINILICSFGIFVFGFYLIYDTQLILDNKTNSLSSEDYILASFVLYLDIINLFLYILELLSLLFGRGNN